MKKIIPTMDISKEDWEILMRLINYDQSKVIVGDQIWFSESQEWQPIDWGFEKKLKEVETLEEYKDVFI